MDGPITGAISATLFGLWPSWWSDVPIVVGIATASGLVLVMALVAGAAWARRSHRTRERTFQTMMNEVPLALWAHNAAGDQEWVNDTYCRYFGVSREETQGVRWHDLVHPDDNNRYAAAFRTAVSNRQPFHSRVRVRRGDGAWRWLESWGRPRVDADGDYRGHIGASADVTEEVEAVTGLATSERRFRSLIDLMPAGVYTCDQEGRINLFNEQAAEIWGRRPHPGDTLETFCGSFSAWRPDGTALERSAAPMLQALVNGVGRRNELIVLDRADGTRATIAAYVDPLRAEDGAINGAINVFVDVSEQVAADKALTESAAFTRRVLDQMFTFAGVLTPDGTLLEANQAPLQVAGLEPGDVIGRKFWDCYWWSCDPGIQHELRAAVTRAAAGEAVRYDVPVRVLDGDLLWIDFQISPLCNDSGEITHLIPSGTDITARRQAQQLMVETLAGEREARQRVELLRQSAANLGSAATVEDIATAVLADVEQALGLTLSSLDVVDGDRITMFASPRVPAGVVSHFPADGTDRALPGPAVIVDGTTVVCHTADDIHRRFPLVASATAGQPVASLAAFPLRDPCGVAVGALVLGSEAPHWFTGDRLELLSGIADQTAQALVRARLHHQVLEARDREQSISRRLQESLLPDKLVAHPALPVVARYQAAAEALTVGGDWFDTFAWPDGRIGLILADVAGHDLDATASMGRLRAALAALAPLIEPSPSEVLTALDRCAEGPLGTVYVTAACVVVDPATGRASYATAGHPPPLLLRADGSTSWLDQAISPPAGVLEGGPRPEAVVDLAPGDTVLLYSDGLIERRNRPIGDGLDLLAQLAAAPPGSDENLGRLVDRLIGDLGQAGPAVNEDDVAVLAARYTPMPGPFHHRFPSDASHLATARRQIGAWLSASGVGRAASDDIQLALSEAMTNAIEHAYRDANGVVIVDLARCETEIVARVSDHGTWRPPRSNPDRGRGTTIMAALANHFDRRTGEDGTTVVLHLPVEMLTR